MLQGIQYELQTSNTLS